jgi:hypothetical protein
MRRRFCGGDKQMGADRQSTQPDHCLQRNRRIRRLGGTPCQQQRIEHGRLIRFLAAEFQLDVVAVETQQTTSGNEAKQSRGNKRAGHRQRIGKRKTREVDGHVLVVQSEGAAALAQPCIEQQQQGKDRNDQRTEHERGSKDSTHAHLGFFTRRAEKNRDNGNRGFGQRCTDRSQNTAHGAL